MNSPENKGTGNMTEISADKLRNVVGGVSDIDRDGRSFCSFLYCPYCKMNTIVLHTGSGGSVCSVCKKKFK